MVSHIFFNPLSWIHHFLVNMAFEGKSDQLNNLAQVPDGRRCFPGIDSIFRSGIWNMVETKHTKQMCSWAVSLHIYQEWVGLGWHTEFLEMKCMSNSGGRLRWWDMSKSKLFLHYFCIRRMSALKVGEIIINRAHNSLRKLFLENGAMNISFLPPTCAQSGFSPKWWLVSKKQMYAHKFLLTHQF